MLTLLLLAGLTAVFLGIALALAATGAISSDRSQVARTLASIERSGPVADSMRAEVDPPFMDRIVIPMSLKAVSLGRWLTPDDWAGRVRKRLDLAGNPAGWDSDRILAAKVAWAMGLGGVTAMLALMLGWGLFGLLAAAGLAVLGFFGPDQWLSHRAEHRAAAMRRSLSDSLDLLTISVESGLAFDAALSNVATNTSGPLAEEFQRTLQEIQLGTRRADALRAMADRTGVDELDYFVASLVQADKLGIPVSDVLRVQAAEMRLKRTQATEEAAAKLPVKILFPLMLCIMPALFVVLLGPAVIRMAGYFGGS